MSGSENQDVATEWTLPASLEGLASINPAGIAELLDSYVEDTAARLERLRAAFDRGDLIMLAREAHSLIGSSSQMGVNRIPPLCRLLQVAAAGRMLYAIRQCLEGMDKAFTAAAPAMRRYAGQTRAGALETVAASLAARG
jgi:histidine phosphotransfer protein HptB